MAQFVFAELDAFFDRRKVQAAMDRKTGRVLGGTGAATRKFVQRSMRKAGKRGGKAHTSKPGQPPRWHTKILRDRIAFSYDSSDQSVVIGPVALSSNEPDGPSNRKTIPELLEFGGTVRKRATKRRLKSGRVVKKPARTLTYKPRPYIAPAVPYAAKVMREKMTNIPLK